MHGYGWSRRGRGGQDFAGLGGVSFDPRWVGRNKPVPTSAGLGAGWKRERGLGGLGGLTPPKATARPGQHVPREAQPGGRQSLVAVTTRPHLRPCRPLCSSRDTPNRPGWGLCTCSLRLAMSLPRSSPSRAGFRPQPKPPPTAPALVPAQPLSATTKFTSPVWPPTARSPWRAAGPVGPACLPRPCVPCTARGRDRTVSAE